MPAEASRYLWYAVIEDDTLEQGDFFFSCSVLEPNPLPAAELGSDVEIQATEREYDVLVLSQSCDLEQGKLETVLVCPHWPIEFLDEQGGFFRSSKGKEEIRRGNVPGLHMLAACDIREFASSARFVSFRQVFGLPFDYVQSKARAGAPRLRLLPPYREHLAQAFARFIMRVGLPVDIPPFK